MQPLNTDNIGDSNFDYRVTPNATAPSRDLRLSTTNLKTIMESPFAKTPSSRAAFTSGDFLRNSPRGRSLVEQGNLFSSLNDRPPTPAVLSRKQIEESLDTLPSQSTPFTRQKAEFFEKRKQPAIYDSDEEILKTSALDEYDGRGTPPPTLVNINEDPGSAQSGLSDYGLYDPLDNFGLSDDDSSKSPLFTEEEIVNSHAQDSWASKFPPNMQFSMGKTESSSKKSRKHGRKPLEKVPVLPKARGFKKTPEAIPTSELPSTESSIKRFKESSEASSSFAGELPTSTVGGSLFSEDVNTLVQNAKEQFRMTSSSSDQDLAQRSAKRARRAALEVNAPTLGSVDNRRKRGLST